MHINSGTVNVVTTQAALANLNGKVKRRGIVKGIATVCLCVGVFAGAIFALKGCSNRKTKNGGATPNASTSGATISDETISDATPEPAEATPVYTEDELKIVYLDKETYLENIKVLAQYLNEYGNKNVKPVDLNSFYYLANMENIKSSTFKELVEEGYLPESETDIIISALGIMDDLRDTIALDAIAGKEADFDYSKMFANSRTAKVFEAAQRTFNGIVATSQEVSRDEILEKTELATPVVEELTALATLEDYYELGENTLNEDIREFGTLNSGVATIYYNIVTKAYDIVLANYGISVGGEARENRRDDISNLVVDLRDEFACMQEENAKQLTK